MHHSTIQHSFYNLLATLILLCFCSNVEAQNDKKKVHAYIADIETYEHATTLIVRERKYAEGVAELTRLIERCEARNSYPKNELASYYRTRGHGQFALGNKELALADTQKSLALLSAAGDAGKVDLSLTWYRLASIYYNMDKQAEAMHAVDQAIQTALDYYGPLHSETLEAYSLRSNLAGIYNLKDIA